MPGLSCAIETARLAKRRAWWLDDIHLNQKYPFLPHTHGRRYLVGGHEALVIHPGSFRRYRLHRKIRRGGTKLPVVHQQT